MKIDGTNKAGGVSSTSKKKRAAAAGGDFASLISGADKEEGASNVTGVQPMGMLEGLLAIQQLENDVMEKKQAMKRGNDVLDYLDQLRHSLLRGKLSTLQVQNLASAVKELNYNVADPRLKSVLSAIETRAAVELAKLEMNRVTPPSA